MGDEMLHTNRIDLHVHILGNGLSGSGCRVSLRWWQRPFVEMMARDIGTTMAPDDPALDDAYVDRLVRWVQESSLEKVVILACDDLFDETGGRHPGLSGIYVPNDRVLELARAHPEFLAGVSIHPARKDAIAELERCVAGGAVLLKLLPCVQAVDCNRQAYRPFWQRLAELGIPFLAHTGGEFSLPTHRPDLRSPAMLRLPLERGVKVIAAHCGTRALPWHPDYFDEFDTMRRSYPNLYGDVAALSQPVHLRTLEKLRENPERILYGSDYPVVTAAFWSLAKGWITGKEYRDLRALRNPLERKYRLTQALGFPDRVFSEVQRVLGPLQEIQQGSAGT
jgi:uncharacterized protein